MTGLPPPIDNQRSDLESLITTEEIESTVNSLPNGKSPGPNGITKAYYTTFSTVLMNPMCRYFNSLTKGSIIPPEALLAHILVIPKEGKDPTVPQSYRPISLLNTNIKILAKILANQLKYLMPHIIHPDQTGFITGVRLEIIQLGQFNLYTGLGIGPQMQRKRLTTVTGPTSVEY